MSETIIKVENLVKKYGKLEAVKNISFEVKKGEIFALIGPNGAGKTTTLRIISTILKPTSGKVSVYGYDVVKDAVEVRKIISYLPEEAGAYKNLTGLEYLNFMASLFSDSKQKVKSFVEYGAEISGLKDRLKDKIGSYSKGMIRKLLLARTVMVKPKLAILDEPTSGLDVINSIEIRKLIKSLTNDGMSVLLSSHNMLEIEYLSDRVSIIHKGQIYIIDTPDNLKEKYLSNNLEEVFVNLIESTTT